MCCNAIIYTEGVILVKMTDFFDLLISDFCSANLYDASPKMYPMSNHGRKHHGLIYTFKGTEVYNFHDCSVKAVPNSVAYLPKGRSYFITLEGDESSVITLDFELPCETDIAPFVIELGSNNNVDALFIKSVNEWQNRRTAYKVVCMSLLYNIIANCARTEEKFIHPGKYEKIRDAVDYLHSHFTEQNFRIEKLSEMSGINSAYFARIFSDKFGMAPKEYVTELKLRRAREMLSQEKYSVSEIGMLLGYSDVYHFSKSFKKGVGMSPVEWRSSNKN